jgi:membrane associated rhomboid family serine protease
VVSEPDLFVVCKNCSSEVSPYVTECPYCGQRVRKRAPKIERGEGAEPKPPKRARRSTSLPRLRRGEIPGIAAETRPYGTLALIVVALAVTVLYAADELTVVDHLALNGLPLDGDYWKLVSSAFVFLDHFGYAFVALTAVGVFGTMLERRFGLPFVLVTFLLAAAGGFGLTLAIDSSPVAVGANGAALGLLCAWLVDDWLARRRGDDRENDLLGVYVFAVVLLLIPVAEPDASVLAGIGGAAVGTVIGAIASPFRP